MDLLTYLQNYEPDELVRVGNNVYSTREHDSVRISNGLWHQFSSHIGGKTALDYLIKVRQIPFPEAVACILRRCAPVAAAATPRTGSAFVLPDRAKSDQSAKGYLRGRGISPEVIEYCFRSRLIYEGVTRSKSGRSFRNTVFVGYDETGVPRYAALRGIHSEFKQEAKGSDKRYAFRITAERSDTVHLFESAMDGTEREPFNVIYQTAEDGLADTIKPRLIAAGADESRVLNINEDECSLTFLDRRIEKAICETGARLLILDPMQGYLGDRMDMNRANETRGVMRAIAKVAERTGCAVVIVGHLNKASGQSSAYRGLGSIDFRAAARSVLVVGRLKQEPNVRVIVHDKSSLAPEGKSLAFHLGDEDGFYWLEGYDTVTTDELLSRFPAESKTAMAEAIGQALGKL